MRHPRIGSADTYFQIAAVISTRRVTHLQRADTRFGGPR